MDEYVPALIWLASSVACIIIARRRHIRATAFKIVSVTLLGPFAIPFILAARPEKTRQA